MASGTNIRLVACCIMLKAALWLLSEVATLRNINLLVFLVLQWVVSLIGLFVLCRLMKPMFPMI